MRTPTFVLALALSVACTMAEDDKAAASLKAVSDSTGHFSTSFFKEVAAKNAGKNLISSPLSAHIALSMAAYGANGNTAKQMHESLYLPADDAVARQGFENLMDQLNNVENVTLEVANKMYLAENMKLKPEYKQLTTGSFRSGVAQIDITKPTESAKVINGWVDERTHHKIKDIVSADDITPDSRMFLLNAVYFKGKWAKAFKTENTQDRTFHLDEKTEKKVPTMFVNGDFYYGELPDLKAKFIELPYENKNIKMVIIVPDEINGLANVVANLEQFNHSRLAKSGFRREVQLYLPKFKIESTMDLKEPLQKLGMTDMFTDGANFTGIAEEPLKISKVLQKAYIEVNEEGSEAAAVTAVVGAVAITSVTLPRLPVLLAVNRPFFFWLLDDKAKVTLFSGQIAKP